MRAFSFVHELLSYGALFQIYVLADFKVADVALAQAGLNVVVDKNSFHFLLGTTQMRRTKFGRICIGMVTEGRIFLQRRNARIKWCLLLGCKKICPLPPNVVMIMLVMGSDKCQY